MSEVHTDVVCLFPLCPYFSGTSSAIREKMSKIRGDSVCVATRVITWCDTVCML